MRHITYCQSDTYPIALLIKSSNFKEQDIKEHYVDVLNKAGISSNDIVCFTAEYNSNGKAPTGFIKDYLMELLPILKDLDTKYIYCADANYFKVLTKQSKAEPHWGYILPCAIPGYENIKIVLGLNHKVLVYDPTQTHKLERSINTLIDAYKNSYVPPGTGILKNVYYPETIEEIYEALQQLLNYDYLATDVETFDLKVWKAGIGSICFAWNQYSGISFPVDLHIHGKSIRNLLKDFFTAYKGNLRMHKGSFDAKILIYNLWMHGGKDYKGMLEGLHCITKNLDDTLLMSYLATNSTVGNSLSLKDQAQEFAGNWAVEVSDITSLPLKSLLQYNLVDGLCTNYVYDKHIQTLHQENQYVLYKELFLPSLKTIIQMELVGMPMNLHRLEEVNLELHKFQSNALNKVVNSPIVVKFNKQLQQQAMEIKNASLKVKQYPLEHFKDVVFNPNSPPQLQQLLFEKLGLPILDYTATKQPSVGGGTLSKLIHHSKTQEEQDFLSALIEYKKVNKILDTFLPAFNEGWLKENDYRWLHGSFNLGGTVSGRLSSSDPNMQNLPATSTYGKTIKTIFQAPPGWIFVGADFASLEDRINALLTKDPNKLKVYTDGFDGHCLRAFAYFSEQMQGIDPNDVDSINSITSKYPALRQESKTPTFALTYLGTWITLMKNLGWSEEKAKKVENSFRALYAVSEQWVKEKIKQASKDGYCEVAFGLRVRTPLLKKTNLGTSVTPKEAEAEARTLGNAVSGQSYGLLNSRAMNAVMERVWASPYAEQILPVAQIHDAGYYLIKDDPEVVAFANNLITEEMSWQELPEIAHDQVKLFANLDLFYPNWANPITLPSKVTPEQVIEICRDALNKRKEK